MIQQRSRSQRRVKVKTPAGKIVIHYRPREKAKPHCGNCGAVLPGVSYKRSISASKKRPSRPYGGTLCSKCSRSVLKERMVRENA